LIQSDVPAGKSSSAVARLIAHLDSDPQGPTAAQEKISKHPKEVKDGKEAKPKAELLF
jgi:hypothetical protein